MRNIENKNYPDTPTCFFFNDTATTEIYTLSLHDALPILDVLVNNAAIVAQTKLVDTTLEDWNRMFAINMTGVFLCTKAVVPSMRERKEGRIINFASQLAQLGADRKSTRLNSSHIPLSRMPSSA